MKVGDTVKLSGSIFTARDRAHKYLVEEMTPESLEFDLGGGILYHCGPLVRVKDGDYELVVAGPTTSNRMNPYEPDVIARYGIRAIIGKGGMDERTLESLGRNGCVYLAAVSGSDGHDPVVGPRDFSGARVKVNDAPFFEGEVSYEVSICTARLTGLRTEVLA